MTAKKNGLGRGFESLIPTDFSLSDVASPGEQVKNIPIEKILVNPAQPRKQFDEDSLKELAQSIKQHGIIQPLVVTPKGDKYRIVAGERRYRASKIANISSIPAIIRNHAELEELEIALVENVQRVDLSPLEQAISIVKLRDQFSLSLKQISKKLGKAETTISNTIRLLQLPKKAVESLQKNVISEGHARAILALKTDKKAQIDLLNKIVTQKLSVRAAEKLVKDYKKGKKPTALGPKKELVIRAKKIEKKLGVKIKINQKKRGGSVSLSYKNENELDSILKKLEKA